MDALAIVALFLGSLALGLALKAFLNLQDSRADAFRMRNETDAMLHTVDEAQAQHQKMRASR